MIITPTGKVTVIDGSNITGAYNVAIPTGDVKLNSKELYRANVIRITNNTDARIVARKIRVQAIDDATGIPNNFQIDSIGYEEDDNFPQIIIEVGETVYLKKNSGNTTIVSKTIPGDPPTPAVYEENQLSTEGEIYSLYQIDGAPTAGNVYASPVAISG